MFNNMNDWDKITVGQLIEKLKEFPQDARVIIHYDMFAYSTIDSIEYDEKENDVEIGHDN